MPEAERSPQWGALIRSPRDFYGGLALLGLALFALYASSDLEGMQGFRFGPGTAPRLFAIFLAAFGVIVAGIGLIFDGPRIERFAVRGPVAVLSSILAFAVAINFLGLILTSFLTFMIASLGAKDVRWPEATLTAVALTAFCGVLFRYLLNLPFDLWPQF
jgi:putative tricarboxylic transport membrane protein